ncbi:MAG: ATP-binding protein, partial [Oscillospiraceae bacterium]|nr:ATP-binding protein [Oscillospiraceae bacterium]
AIRHGGSGKEQAQQFRLLNLELQAREKELLKACGLGEDYLKNEPECELCSDSGYMGSAVCSCVKNIYARLQTAALDKKLDFENHNFSRFDLTLYSPVVDRRRGISPRENMENILEYCTDYAYSFSKNSPNLAFFGSTGLGKTFLSACIAQVVSQKGFYVSYGSAGEIFSAYEAEKFSRGAQGDQNSSSYTECDLLVLDDLGTEMVTQFTLSALYSLINTRLMHGKKTIISSNLSLEELKRSYTPQIVSRLEGEYRNFTFFGEDIRLKRKNRF